MKKQLIYFYFCIIPILGIAQNINYPVLKQIIDLTKEQSIYTKNVDWTLLEPLILNTVDTNTTDTLAAIKPAFIRMLDSLKDEHSHLIYKGITISKPKNSKAFSRVSNAVRKALLTQMGVPFISKKLNDSIGYIAINGISASSESKTPGDPSRADVIGQKIRDALCLQNLRELKGIIIDLRLNIGGSMYPMISGVAPLIGKGLAGGFIDN